MIETKHEFILMILMIDFEGDCLLSEWVRWGEFWVGISLLAIAGEVTLKMKFVKHFLLQLLLKLFKDSPTTHYMSNTNSRLALRRNHCPPLLGQSHIWELHQNLTTILGWKWLCRTPLKEGRHKMLHRKGEQNLLSYCFRILATIRIHPRRLIFQGVSIEIIEQLCKKNKTRMFRLPHQRKTFWQIFWEG